MDIGQVFRPAVPGPEVELFDQCVDVGCEAVVRLEYWAPLLVVAAVAADAVGGVWVGVCLHASTVRGNGAKGNSKGDKLVTKPQVIRPKDNVHEVHDHRVPLVKLGHVLHGEIKELHDDPDRVVGAEPLAQVYLAVG